MVGHCFGIVREDTFHSGPPAQLPRQHQSHCPTHRGQQALGGLGLLPPFLGSTEEVLPPPPPRSFPRPLPPLPPPRSPAPVAAAPAPAPLAYVPPAPSPARGAGPSPPLPPSPPAASPSAAKPPPPPPLPAAATGVGPAAAAANPPLGQAGGTAGTLGRVVFRALPIQLCYSFGTIVPKGMVLVTVIPATNSDLSKTIEMENKS